MLAFRSFLSVALILSFLDALRLIRRKNFAVLERGFFDEAAGGIDDGGVAVGGNTQEGNTGFDGSELVFF